MRLDAQLRARPVRTTSAAALARARRGSLAALVLLAAEYVIGMYVNLYSHHPRADRRRGLGSAITNGPAMLTIHAVPGLGALAALMQAIIARHRGAIATSALGLFALAFASMTRASFTSSGKHRGRHGHVGPHRRGAAVLRGKSLPAAPAPPAWANRHGGQAAPRCCHGHREPPRPAGKANEHANPILVHGTRSASGRNQA